MQTNNLTIELVDVGARDGLQNEPNAARLTVDDKVEFILALARAGLMRIEAGSFVKPSAVPAMADTGEVAQRLKEAQKDFPEVIFSYLVPNLKGLARAKSAEAKEVAVFLALSEQFSKANINAASVEQSFMEIAPVIAQAREEGMRVRGYLSTVFGYADWPFSPEEAARRSRQLLAMGCFEVSLGDTTGIAAPGQVQAVIAALRAQRVPLEKIAMHFHDTNGRAIANVEAAYAAGIRVFDAATGGLGGCPYANSPKGNLAMEDLVRWCLGCGLSCGVARVEDLTRPATIMLKKLGKQA